MDVLDGFGDDITTEEVDNMIESILNEFEPNGILDNLLDDLSALDGDILDSLLDTLDNPREGPKEQNVQPKSVKAKDPNLQLKKLKPKLPNVKPQMNILEGAEYICSICDYRTTKRHLIRRHTRRHTHLQQCNFCYYETKFKSHLKMHMERYHKNKY